jgi:hypothetical protein
MVDYSARKRKEVKKKGRERRSEPKSFRPSFRLTGEREDVPTKQNDNSVTLSWDEPEQEYVFASAVIAFGRRLSEGRFGVEDDFFVLCSDEVVDDVGGRGRPPGVAEPFRADQALKGVV